jgi:hypothetical protein
MLINRLEANERSGPVSSERGLKGEAIFVPNAVGLIQRALALLGEAIQTYERLGMRVYAERGRRLLESAEAWKSRLKEAAARNRFERDGRYWVITWQGQSARIKDSAGLRYIPLCQ